jgi:hypothetical protein
MPGSSKPFLPQLWGCPVPDVDCSLLLALCALARALSPPPPSLPSLSLPLAGMQACIEGSTFSSDGSLCLPVTDCSAEQFQVAAPTVTSNRQCAFCSAGSYLSGQQCVPVSTCPAGQEEFAAPTTTTDRSCKV